MKKSIGETYKWCRGWFNRLLLVVIGSLLSLVAGILIIIAGVAIGLCVAIVCVAGTLVVAAIPAAALKGITDYFNDDGCPIEVEKAKRKAEDEIKT